MEAISDGRYRLSTGREFAANCHVIGMSPQHGARLNCDEDGVTLPEGWDGGITVTDPAWADDGSNDMTPDEQREIADYMIALWQSWRAAI